MLAEREEIFVDEVNVKSGISLDLDEVSQYLAPGNIALVTEDEGLDPIGIVVAQAVVLERAVALEKLLELDVTSLVYPLQGVVD